MNQGTSQELQEGACTRKWCQDAHARSLPQGTRPRNCIKEPISGPVSRRLSQGACLRTCTRAYTLVSVYCTCRTAIVKQYYLLGSLGSFVGRLGGLANATMRSDVSVSGIDVWKTNCSGNVKRTKLFPYVSAQGHFSGWQCRICVRCCAPNFH